MIHQSTLFVRYAETDQMGFAHHANYAIWYELGRTEFVKKLGYTHSQLEQMGILTPILDLECHYHLAAYYEDELIVEVALTALSRVKMAFCYRIMRRADGKLLNTGKTVLGMIGRDLRPINVKKEFPKVYAALQRALTSEDAFYG